MKSQWFKILWRFWPGLLSLAVTFLLLAWGLEPRPRTIASFPFDGPISLLNHALSPDGNYLATHATGIISGGGGVYSALALHEISSQREIFSKHDYITEFRFDDDGSLAYLVYQRNHGEGKNDKLQLHRWRPDTLQSQMLWEHEVVDPETTQRTFAYLSNNTASNDYRLSPDSRTLLFATYQKGKLHGELLDGLTGNVRNDFSLTKSASGQILLPEVQVVFTFDSKKVVLQTSEINETGMGHFWHWVDVQSGQVLQTVKIPSELIIVEMLLATATSPVAKATNRPGSKFLVSAINKEIQAIQLVETKQSEMKGTEQSKITAEIHINYRAFPEHHVVYYEWFHFGGSRWAIRDVEHSNVIRSESVSLEYSSDNQATVPFSFLTALSSQYFLFQDTSLLKPEVLQQWLSKLRTWLGMKQGEFASLHLLDGTSGKFLRPFHVPQGQITAFLSQDAKILTVVSGYDKRIELRTYDFPLHRPWLLIWTWALGVAGAITLLVEARRWWRRPKNVQAPFGSSGHRV